MLLFLAYLSIAYAPFSVAIGLLWLGGATWFRMSRRGGFSAAFFQSLKPALLVALAVYAVLLGAGILAFSTGH